MYAQIIDDEWGHMLASASTLTVKAVEGKKAEKAKAVG
jgi:ribosomal protein L18